MDTSTVWSHIHRERRALAADLASLPESAWSRGTLCDGWSVHDVAAHVIAHPQLGWRHVPGTIARNPGRGMNAIIFHEVKRWAGARSREQILAEYELHDGSVRHAPMTTPLEALIDVLVHSQDILRPLGRTHDMPPDAAAVAATRSLKHTRRMGWRHARGLRLEATDVDWSSGEGALVRGPVQELLMLIVDRAPDTTLLSGEGLARLTPKRLAR